jgi:NTE family protein
MKNRPRLHAMMITACMATVALLAAAHLHAKTGETTATPGKGKKPKICLVLSGGGARGAAHVGVIKVLEELRVPIHCITGTSMGALVGAGYATGTTVPEMEEILKEITTELLFKENPPREERPVRRKQDDYRLFFGPEIGVTSNGLGLPKGVVTGVQLETVLRRLAKAKGYYQFDKLPIPFRAVATDLVTGKAVVFRDGELANVMRASMSVPGAVAPAEFGGMMLVDGMLTSNLPVEAARAMGADIIIAVNVGTPLLKRESLTSILGVTGQMLSILTEQNVQTSLASLKPTDILISPELGDFSTGDFDHLAKIAPTGEAAARKLVDRLTLLSVSEKEYADLRRHQQIAVAPDLQPVDEIRFDNLTRVNPVAAQAVMDTQPRKPIDQQTLDRDMRRLYGSGDFEHVNYRFLEEPGRRVLAVDAIEKSWGPDYLRFGLGLSSDFTGDAYFNLLASYRKTWINALGAEWRTDLQVGRTSRLATEFYQPLNAEGDFFIAPHAALERRSTTIYSGDNRVARYDFTSSMAGVDLGLNFRRYGEIRLGVLAGTLDPSLDTGPRILAPPEKNIDVAGYRARLFFDRLDSVSFPRSGWSGGMNIYDSNTALGSAVNYTKWDIDGSTAYSFGNHTVNFAVKAGGALGDNRLPYYDQFQWGGFMQLSGYKTGQLYGETLSFGRAMYYHRIMQGTILEGAYGGFSLEAGRVGAPLVPGSPDGLLTAGSIFIAVDSPLGPAYLGYGRASGGVDSLYFYLGKQF